jgi:hypothetical protein
MCRRRLPAACNPADVPRRAFTRCRDLTTVPCQIGSLKRAHHSGLNRTATFEEQLILQDSVTQSISSPLLSFSVGAAALAAGDKLLLFGAAWGANWGE